MYTSRQCAYVRAFRLSYALQIEICKLKAYIRILKANISVLTSTKLRFFKK